MYELLEEIGYIEDAATTTGLFPKFGIAMPLLYNSGITGVSVDSVTAP